MTTWRALDTHRGRLIEMQATLINARSMLEAVWADMPADDVGDCGELQTAIESIALTIDGFELAIERTVQ